MDRLFRQLLLSHFYITILIMVASAIITSIHSIGLIYLLGILTCLGYFFTGYFFTKANVNWYNYFGIAFVGILFWLICFLVSPNAMNYKQNHNAGIWFLYQLYIFVSSPLNFTDTLTENYSVGKQLILDLLIPIIISALQFFGGFIKLRSLKIPNEAN